MALNKLQEYWSIVLLVRRDQINLAVTQSTMNSSVDQSIQESNLRPSVWLVKQQDDD